MTRTRAHTPEVLIVTGMSGAGRSTAANALEDLDWYVVDNLPPELLPRLADLTGRSQGAVPRIAAVVDVRSGAFFDDLQQAVAELRQSGIDPKVLFLDASDETLVRRFEAVRRPHPLQGEGRIIDGIARERQLVSSMRGDADITIDTTGLNVRELATKVAAAFEAAPPEVVRLTLLTFGFKYGLPVDVDLVADMRFLPNPHWVPELRPHSGLDDDVREYVLTQPRAEEFLDRYADLLRLVSDGYLREGKRFVTVGVGCTGGKHRSVAMAEELAQRLRADGFGVSVVHRDLGRE